MRRRRRSLPVALLLMLAAVLTLQAPALVLGATANQDSGEKVKLVYFNARGGEAVERALIDKYMEENPNIEIEYLSTTAIC
jgi:ABC-type glycerol-3-phosphate transport system substrate-binding protein